MKQTLISLYIILLLLGCSNDENVIGIKKFNRDADSISVKYSTDKVTDSVSGKPDEHLENLEENTVIEPIEARGYLGKELTVEGYVADVFKNERVAYLNFDKKFPNNSFSGVIFAKKFDAFENIFNYKNKTVKLKGKISEYKGRPQIIINSEDQLEIVE